MRRKTPWDDNDNDGDNEEEKPENTKLKVYTKLPVWRSLVWSRPENSHRKFLKKSKQTSSDVKMETTLMQLAASLWLSGTYMTHKLM